MQWNLRLAAAERGIWRSSDLRRLLADAGLEISAGKMSHLWSGRPISIRLDDLDVICGVLGCEPGELLVPDPAATRAASREAAPAAAAGAPDVFPGIRPSRRGGRPLPPV
jgi:DNA-binding Xre family transcriptional regulator